MRSREIPWSVIMRCRDQVAEQYPSIWMLPVVGSILEQVKREIAPHATVLDVGAYQRRLEGVLKDAGFQGTYQSMDVDRASHHDYYTMEDVHGQFDVVTMLELIEHVPETVYVDLLDQAKRVLKKGGKLVVSTPNIFHPYAFHLGGPSHVSPYPFDEMAGLALHKGFTNLRLYRACGEEPLKWRMAFRMVGPLLNKYLGLDYAKSVVMVCER